MMETRQRLSHGQDWLPRIQMLIIWVAIVALGAKVIAKQLWGWDSAPIPFVWSDVALIHFVCALPVAGILAAAWLPRMTGAGSLAIAGLLATFSVLLLLNSAGSSDAGEASSFMARQMSRETVALGIALAATLMFANLLRGRVEQERRFKESKLPLVILAATLWLVVPSVYVIARSQHDSGQLAALLGQSRLGEARHVAHGLVVLNPHATWNRFPVQDVATDLDSKIQFLEARVAGPLHGTASLLDRARDLAILGRTSLALDILRSASELSELPDAWNLRGTIHESRGEWKAGSESYGRAHSLLRSRPSSPEATAALIRAVTGIAYCERKLGDYPLAEKKYRELLALSPTAETHFLLAQFYEDTQRASLAQIHARQAMTLAPDQYQQQATRLIDKLVTLHFGCWGVFSTEMRGGGRERP